MVQYNTIIISYLSQKMKKKMILLVSSLQYFHVNWKT